MFGPVLNSQWGAIHNAFRISFHFLGYGLFSLVCFRAFWMTSKEVIAGLTRKLRAHGLAIFLTFLVASADEIHQTFLPNRVGQFRDVMIDTSGAAVLGCLLLIAMLALDLHRQARAKMCGQPQGASAQVDVLKGTGFSPYINSAKSAGL
jgi:VanZ family protein